MTDLRGILFDKDGTLFNFVATWGRWSRALIADLSAGDARLRDDLARAMGFDLATGTFAPSSLVIAHPTDEIAAEILTHLPEFTLARLVQRMNDLAARAQLVEAVPLRPLMLDLRARGYVLGLATNDGEGPARAHLAEAGIDDLFDFVAGFDSGHGAKPAPDPLLAFARSVGLMPGEILMVGDSRHDLVAGRAAGMRTAGVLTGPATAEDLRSLADVVLPDIGHLPGWLSGAKAALNET